MNYNRIIKIIYWTFGSIFTFIVLLLLTIRFNLFGLFGSLPDSDILENPKSELATEIYASDGVLLGKYYYHSNRSSVEYQEIPQNIINALIATEDVRFTNHSGVDIKGIVAIVPSLLMGKRRGSSTLTQQLAKNLFKLREADEYEGILKGTIVNKIKEWFVAIRLERSYTKEEIVTMYLNTVDFGHNALGIKSAANKYFSKKLKEIELNEAALLIGMLKGPSYYNPLRRKERALNRKNTVLSQMLKYGLITSELYIENTKLPLGLNYNADEANSGLAAHFRSFIKPMLKEWCKENGYSLYKDGLKIYTTLDSRMQSIAEKGIAEHMTFIQGKLSDHWKSNAPWKDQELILKLAKRTERYRELQSEFGNNDKLIIQEMKKKHQMRLFTWQGEIDTTMSSLDSIKHMLQFLHTGFMAMEPKTGHVKSWVGDINFKYFKYDHVKQGKRQPGSTFKPLLYSYVMELKGWNANTTVIDAPVTFTMPDGKTWTPNNSNGKYSNEYLTLREALAKSVNSVSAYLMKIAGPDSLVSFAKRMGINSTLDPVPTLCLGTSDVSVYELVNAYSTFINKGMRYEPQFILRIDDKYGNTIEEFKPYAQHVLSENTANNMIELLKGSVEESGGTSVSLKRDYKIIGDIGGKTGTTQNSSDGWFIAVTPELVCGAWVGGEERQIRFRTMQYGQGAKLALPICANYIKGVYNNRDLSYEKFFPKNLTVDEIIKSDTTVTTENNDTLIINNLPQNIATEDINGF